jgi:DHA1 family bicyclomycin/chloramphenicol resistance-like MFS transporter
MLRPDTFALTALLALLTAIGPLSMDLYLPALPAISAALGTTTAASALTISFYLVGFAAGQVAYGPLSDRRGRKPVMFGAILIYCVATVVCALAPTIEALIAARFLQAFGSSGAIVLSRAVVRDLYDGPRAGRELSLMAMIMGLAPIVAPVIGSGLLTAFGWRACFVFLVCAGIAAAAAVYWLLPETLRKRPHTPSSGLIASIGVVARNRSALAYMGMIAGGYGGLFAFISGSPFALQSVYALDPFGYALAFAIASVGYIAGSWLAAKLVVRIGIDHTIGWGVLCFVVASAAMIAATALAPQAVAGFVAPMTLYLFGLGLAMPQALAGALQPFPERAGAASSLIGCVQQAVAASTGALVAHALGATAWPLVIGIAVPGTAALAIWAVARRVRGRATGSGRARD